MSKLSIIILVSIIVISFSMNIHVQDATVDKLIGSAISLYLDSSPIFKDVQDGELGWLNSGNYPIICGVVFDYGNNSILTYSYNKYFNSVPRAMMNDLIDFNEYVRKLIVTQLNLPENTTYQYITDTNNVYVGYYLIDMTNLLYLIFSKNKVIVANYMPIFLQWLQERKQGGL